MNLKNNIRNWLGIKEAKDWTKEFKRLEKEMWKHDTVLKRQAKTPCIVCKENILVWPFNTTEAYYVRKNGPCHIKCGEKK